MKEDKLTNLIKDSKLKAGEGFRDRVMHQIETEQALRPKKNKIPSYSTPPTFGVFAVMYGVILIVGLFFYFNTGSNLLGSSFFLKIIGLITSISSVFYLISVFDDSKIINQK